MKIEFDTDDTILVGPNNSGKTSIAAAFRLFLISSDFKVYDFSARRVMELDAFGENKDDETLVPSIEMDIWFEVNPKM